MSPSGIQLTNLPSFRSVLREYLEHTKRALPVILNTKGFYILRGATRRTARADAGKIKSSLDAPSRTPGVTVAEAIIAARMRRAGRQLTPGEFASEVKALKASRVRSRGFTASGWLPGIKSLAPYAERKGKADRIDARAIRQFGQAKGSATPAQTSSWVPSVTFENRASTKRDPRALIQYGEPPFVAAWEAEIQSTRDYITEKIQKENDKVNAR